ncbi:MAG: energy-coupling factor transporter transmembrane protein EcfT [Clostridia bacterium]|nr:energy-coupling factor transporter transmembrane protein EcfT [Clostridia bacterium]MBQ9996207.1 energy-coupling factor transporter transmembrane protein EcfT [Clostridia bacterium]
MKSDITFGQYVEGNSLIHRLDPRMKIVLSILYIVTIFLAKSVTAFALLTLSAFLLIALTGLSPAMILRGMRPLLFIIVFTAVFNIFWMTGDTLLISLGPIKIYLEGIINAVLIILRIVLLIVATSVFLTYTTTPLALTDGLEQLLAPLKKLHVPVHEFSMMMTIALRFIPTLIDETQKIMNAQKARGADFSTGNLLQRAKALIPILIPLFISAFRRADELATAMECRCYTGGEGRTRMNVLRSTPKDWAAAFVVLVLGAAIVLANLYFPLYGLTL